MVIDFWKDKKVLITGHTGFKGAWLSIWLNSIGANVFGFALESEEKSLFRITKFSKKINHLIADLKDKDKLESYIIDIQPDIVFHLAAKPLVIYSYNYPIDTWETNVLGTINLLESLKKLNKKCAVIVITTDKVYHNYEKQIEYKEGDRLGGYDPYSSSKAAVELVVDSWRNSFFKSKEIRIASARAGNVIGGGDWSQDRIIPDAVNSLTKNKNILIRNPNFIRPWQHVLDPLNGYLILAENLFSNDNLEFQSAFNFGPEKNQNKTVLNLVNEILKNWSGNYEILKNKNDFHEANLLSLSILKARSVLNWNPIWNFEQSIFKTIEWYKQDLNDGEKILDFTNNQIDEFNSKK